MSPAGRSSPAVRPTSVRPSSGGTASGGTASGATTLGRSRSEATTGGPSPADGTGSSSGGASTRRGGSGVPPAPQVRGTPVGGTRSPATSAAAPLVSPATSTDDSGHPLQAVVAQPGHARHPAPELREVLELGSLLERRDHGHVHDNSFLPPVLMASPAADRTGGGGEASTVRHVAVSPGALLSGPGATATGRECCGLQARPDTALGSEAQASVRASPAWAARAPDFSDSTM